MKPLEQTAEYIKFVQVLDFVNENQNLFYEGNEFPVTPFTDYFNIPRPITTGSELDVIKSVLSFNRKRTEWQNRVNRILAQRGLYMSMNAGRLRVKNKLETKRKIKSFYVDSYRKASRGKELARGVRKYNCKYSKPVTNVELLLIVSSLNGEPSGRNPHGQEDIT